jgi:hypothetical protein
VLNWSATWVYAPIQKKSHYSMKSGILQCETQKKKEEELKHQAVQQNLQEKNSYSVKLPTQFTMQTF